MRARPSLIAAACIALVLLAGCDSYSLLDSFTIAEPPAAEPEPDPDPEPVPELTLDVGVTELQPGESTTLTPTGGTEPYSWVLLKGDHYYTDSSNPIGSVTANTYTAGNSIGTVTVRLRDSTGSMKEAVITVIPPAPTDFSVTKSGTGSLTIAWTYANTDYISGFKLFRSVNGADSTEIPVPGKTTTSVTQTSLIKPNTYTYYLAAVAVSPAGATYRLPSTVQDFKIPD